MGATTTIFLIGCIVGFAISVAFPKIPTAIYNAIAKAKAEKKQEDDKRIYENERIPDHYGYY